MQLAPYARQSATACNGVLLPAPPEVLPNLENVVTEDDTPVDNIFSEKQQRLLTEPLYSSWAGPGEGRTFQALANVGLFFAAGEPPVVPDGMLSLDVVPGEDIWRKENRSYFVWIAGKAPEVVVEVVSNREGGEGDVKVRLYARIGIPYYVVFDPQDLLGGGVLRVLRLNGRTYQPIEPGWMPEVGLGLMLWQGKFEDREALWLRWCDRDGRPIPTGAELAEAARQQAEAAHQRADTAEQRAATERRRAETAEQRAETERQRAEQLAAQLRALGIEPPP